MYAQSFRWFIILRPRRRALAIINRIGFVFLFQLFWHHLLIVFDDLMSKADRIITIKSSSLRHARAGLEAKLEGGWVNPSSKSSGWCSFFFPLFISFVIVMMITRREKERQNLGAKWRPPSCAQRSSSSSNGASSDWIWSGRVTLSASLM